MTSHASQDVAIRKQKYYRWRKDCSSLQVDRARRLKELDQEIATLEAAGRGDEPGQSGKNLW